MHTARGDQLQHNGRHRVPLEVHTLQGSASAELHMEVAHVARPIVSVSRLASHGIGLFVELGGGIACLVARARGPST